MTTSPRTSPFPPPAHHRRRVARLRATPALLPSLVVSAAVLLATTAIPGCESVVGPSVPGPDTLSGTWTGRAGIEDVELTLEQPDPGKVSGFGVIRGPGSSRAFRAEGVRDSTSVTMLLEISVFTFGDPGTVLAHYRARFTGLERMEGTLSGGGYDDISLALRRQPDGLVLDRP